MRRWTEPKQKFTHDVVDFTEFSNINIDYEQGCMEFTIPMERMTVNTHSIEFFLTEEETLMLKEDRNVKIQLRAILDGRNVASAVISIPVRQILKDGELV